MRLHSVFNLPTFLAAFVGLLLTGQSAMSAVPQDKLLEAFKNIRSDDIPHNGEIAMAWLYGHRDELTTEFLDEMYRTDAQGKDAIMYCLMRTKSYNPDARFCQTLVSRLNDEDHLVGDGLGMRSPVHWLAWTYMDRRYDLFKQLLLANLPVTNNMLTIWGTTTLLQKHGDLDKAAPSMSPHVWDTAALSLHKDNVGYNACQAVRFYLLMGQTSLPYLQALANSEDEQTKSFATATINAIGGDRQAYIYLVNNADIGRNLFNHHEVKNPPWVGP